MTFVWSCPAVELAVVVSELFTDAGLPGVPTACARRRGSRGRRLDCREPEPKFRAARGQHPVQRTWPWPRAVATDSVGVVAASTPTPELETTPFEFTVPEAPADWVPVLEPACAVAAVEPAPAPPATAALIWVPGSGKSEQEEPLQKTVRTCYKKEGQAWQLLDESCVTMHIHLSTSLMPRRAANWSPDRPHAPVNLSVTDIDPEADVPNGEPELDEPADASIRLLILEDILHMIAFHAFYLYPASRLEAERASTRQSYTGAAPAVAPYGNVRPTYQTSPSQFLPAHSEVQLLALRHHARDHAEEARGGRQRQSRAAWPGADERKTRFRAFLGKSFQFHAVRHAFNTYIEQFILPTGMCYVVNCGSRLSSMGKASCGDGGVDGDLVGSAPSQ